MDVSSVLVLDASAQRAPSRFPKSFQQFVCLAGMPRAGATLLAGILSQNPAIHVEGTSPMCQMMWDTYLSYQDRCGREFASNRKDHMMPKIVGTIPHVYYQDISAGKTVVVDRCRAWISECNLNMLRGCMDPQIKMIVLERPLQEIVESYARLFSKNAVAATAVDSLLPQLLGDNSEPIVRPYQLIQWSKQQADASGNQSTFCYVTYDELVSNTQATIDRIYAFCGWEPFAHDFNHVVIQTPEREDVYGLIGQYEVRPRVERKYYGVDERITLPKAVMDRIDEIEGKITVNMAE